MLIYLTVAVVILIGIIQFDFSKKNKSEDKILYWFICVLLICIAGFRYRVGGDTLSYFDNYSRWPTINDLATIDYTVFTYQPLWYFFAAICKLISPDFYILQLFL